MTAVKAVRHLRVMLPDGAQQFLERETVLKETDLLKFINADDNPYLVMKRNPLR